MAVRIRLPTDEDVDAILAIYGPIVDTTAISFEVVAPDRAAIARRIGDSLPAHPWLVCEIGDVVAGYAYAMRHRQREAYRWSVETSVYVGDRFQRRGVARGLYQSLLGILAAQGYVTACAGITLPNPASIRLHEALGFEPVGVYRRIGFKEGRWRDVGWWQRTLREPEHSPAEPVDVGTLSERPDWQALVGCGASSIRIGEG